MTSRSGKRMFSISSSDDESIDSDDERNVELRKRRERRKMKRERIGIELPVASKSASSSRIVTDQGKKTVENETIDDGTDGFLIDSTGGAGNMGIKKNVETQSKKEPTPLDPGVDLTKDLYIDLECLRPFRQKTAAKEEEKSSTTTKSTEVIQKIMKKAAYTPAMEKNPIFPRISKMESKRRRKAEREKTKGTDWFNLPATELTEERKRDLEVMQMRDVLDPKSRYRKDDRTVLPKYFQVGTIVEDPTDFYSSRIPRKERKQTIVDELLADANFQKKNKRKFMEIVESKTRYRGKKTEQGETKKHKKRKVQ